MRRRLACSAQRDGEHTSSSENLALVAALHEEQTARHLAVSHAAAAEARRDMALRQAASATEEAATLREACANARQLADRLAVAERDGNTAREELCKARGEKNALLLAFGEERRRMHGLQVAAGGSVSTTRFDLAAVNWSGPSENHMLFLQKVIFMGSKSVILF